MKYFFPNGVILLQMEYWYTPSRATIPNEYHPYSNYSGRVQLYYHPGLACFITTVIPILVERTTIANSHFPAAFSCSPAYPEGS